MKNTITKTAAKQNVVVTTGCVQVATTEYDCDGVQRTIDFDRVGKLLYGGCRYHPSVKQHVKTARQIARNALKQWSGR